MSASSFSLRTPLLLTTTQGQADDLFAELPAGSDPVILGPDTLLPPTRKEIPLLEVDVDEDGFEYPCFSDSDERSVIMTSDKFTPAASWALFNRRSGRTLNTRNREGMVSDPVGEARQRAKEHSQINPEGEQHPDFVHQMPGGGLAIDLGALLRHVLTGGVSGVTETAVTQEPRILPPPHIRSAPSPKDFRVDPVSNRLTYKRPRGKELNLSQAVTDQDKFLRFLGRFFDTTALKEILEDGPPDAGFHSQSIQSAGFMVLDFSLSPSCPQSEVSPYTVDFGGGVSLEGHFNESGNFEFKLHGFLPGNEVWTLVYNYQGRLCYTPGGMKYIDPSYTANATAPLATQVHSETSPPADQATPGVQTIPVKTLVHPAAETHEDLALNLYQLGDPCNASQLMRGPHLHYSSMGEFSDPQSHERIQGRVTPTLRAKLEDNQQQAFSAMGELQQTGDASLILNLLRFRQEYSALVAHIIDRRITLSDGTQLVVWQDPQRLEILDPQGEVAPSDKKSQIDIIHDVQALNHLVDSRQVCYARTVSSDHRQMIHIFIYNREMSEWQYFSRLDYDAFGMRPLTPQQIDKGEPLGRTDREFAVHVPSLEDYWDENDEPELALSDLDLLKKARLVAAQPMRRDAPLQASYRVNVAGFLAKIFEDESGLFLGLSGKDVVDGTIDPWLQYLSFTYSEDLDDVMLKYEQGHRLTEEERALLSSRFQFAVLPDLPIMLGGTVPDALNERLQDWQVHQGLRLIRGRMAQMQSNLRGQTGVFSVLLDLNPGRSRYTGPVNTGGSRRSSDCGHEKGREQPRDGYFADEQ